MRAITLLLTVIYALFLTDLSGQCSVTISQGNDVSIDGLEICLGQSLFLSAADGQEGIPNGTTFQWSTGSSDYFTTVTPTTTSNYGVVVTYPDGCVATDQVTIIVNPPPTVSVQNVSNATCGGADGSATAVANGAGGYNYAWSNGSTGSTISNVPSGSYKVTVVDANGCSATSSAVIGVQGASGISGTVYGDFNYNAVNDQVYQGYQNVVVNLYGADAAGNSVLVSSTTTDVNGDYTFAGVSFANGEVYRLEMEVPANFEVTTNGDIDNLEVRFIDGPTCNENLAISVPTDYCHTDDPPVVMPCYVNGDPLAGGTAGELDAIVSTNYNNEGFPGQPTYTAPSHDAIASQVGSLYGVAYQRFDEVAFFSAYVKRHVGLGTDGIGAIYSIDYSGAVPSAPTTYVDLVADFGLNLGTVLNRDLPAAADSPSYDLDAFDKVGKAGIGDIDMSDDGATMYVTNLHDRTLIQIGVGNPVGAPVLQSILPIPNPCATPADWRPFGLKYYAGKLYVSGVCSGESSGAQPTGYVFEYTPGIGFNPTPIFTMNFDYTRASAFGCGVAPGSPGDSWHPWTATYQGGGYPQPIIADMEFEVDGSMIIGVRDRNSDQLGFKNYLPDPAMSNTALVSGLSIGDILRADPLGDGTYVLENNGISQGKTGCGSGNMQGPGGGEFFCGDLKLCHNEGATGALAKFAGSGEVVSTVYDPHRSYSQGFSRFNAYNGTGFEGYEVYRDDVNNPTGFGKANGLGDIEIFCKPAPIEVGDYVWIDGNKNGIQDPGEEPVAGVTVSLYDAAGALVSQTTTDAEGYYYFYDLDFNTDYSIAIENYNDGLVYNGTTYTPTIVDAGANDNIDSDGVVRGFGVPANVLNKPSIQFTTGLPGQTDHTLDFGFFGCAIEVTSSPDVNICRGLSVTLTANVANANGNVTYNWSNGGVGPSITVSPASTETFTVTAIDDLGCEGISETEVVVENPPVLGIVSPLFLCPNEAGTFSIPNATPGATYLWDFAGGITADGDANDISETVSWPASYAGQTITVTLSGKSGDLQCEATDEVQIEIGGNVEANAGNNIEFCQGTSGVIGGTSAFVAPLGGTINWSPATYLSSTTISNPQVSLPLGVTSITYTVTVTKDGCTSTDEVTVTGLDCKMSIGSTVFVDANNNGLQDATDDGIAGVTVQLLNSAGTVISTTTTDANGDYYFGGLDPGQYQVQIPTPDADYPTSSTPTDTNDNGDDGDDNGIQAGGTGTNTISPVITLSPGTETTNESFQGGTQDDANDADGDMTIDFGFVPQLMSIGSTVFVDNNNNGQQDANDNGIAGVTVELLDDNGNVIITTTTDGAGNYFFGSLLPGQYQVRVTPDVNYPNSSTPTDTADNGQDGDDNGIQTGGPNSVTTSPLITLSANSEPTNEAGQGGNQDAADDANGDMTIDFGFVPQLMSIGSTVFADANDNGLQDANDDGIAGVLVELLDNTGAVVATTNTDASGDYFFGGLLPGVYQVRVTPDVDYPNSSTPTDTNDNGQDGDDNGIQQAGSGSVTVSTLITLSPGTEPTNESGQGGNQDNADDANGDMTIDFGFIPQLMSIGSTVFADPNDNGQQDANEDGIAGVTVNLLDNNGNVLQTTTTDNNGDYYFDNILPGQYQVQIFPNTEYPLSSTPTDTADNGQDGDDNGIQAGGSGTPIVSPLITLAPGTETTNEPGQGGNQDDIDDANGDMTIDFGLFPQLMSIGSTAFVDGNDNGIQDANEGGIAGLSVELLDDNGNVLATQDTDANGNYFFDELLPGDYQVRITPNIDYPDSSTPTDTADNSQDGDDNGIQQAGPGSVVVSPIITLAPGTETTNETAQGGAQDNADDVNGDMTVDFGFIPQFMSIGSTVFVDNNDNGIQDADDDGIPGLVVELIDATGNVVQTTTTNNNGDYFFDNILPGDYQVQVSPNAEFPSSSTPTDTADNNEDGDDNGDQPAGSGTSVISPVITLAPGTEPTNEPGQGGNQDIADDANGNMTIDFGFKPEADVYLEKSVNATTPNVGDIVTFTILVGNDGPTTATGVEVTDLLPSGYTFNGFSVSQGSYNASNGLWNLGTLAVSQTETLVVTAVVNPNGDYLNLAEVTDMDQPDTDSTPGDGVDTDGDGETVDDPGDDDDGDGAEVDPINTADVSLEKSVDNLTPLVGETIVFTIDVSNDGPAIATGVMVRDLLPSGYTFLGFTVSQGTYNTATGMWTLGTLNLNQTETLTVSAEVLASGDYLNLAEVTDMDQPDTDSTPNNGVDTDGDGDSTDDPGDEDDGDGEEVAPIRLVSIGSTVFVDNNDNGLQDAADDGIEGVTVQLLDNTGAVIATTTTDTNGDYFFGSLVPGQYQVQVLPDAEYPSSSTSTDTADNGQDGDDNGDQPAGSGTASISPLITLAPGTEPTNEPGQGGNQDAAADSDGDMTIDFGFKPEADVYLEKSVNTTFPLIGETVTFTILVGNDGPTTATGVEVTDLLPSGYTFAGFTTSQGAYTSSTGLWNVGTLTVGQTETLTVSAIVLATGDYLNLAEVTDMDQPDTDSTPGDGVDTDGDGNTEDDPGDDDDGDGARVMPNNSVDVYLEKSVNNLTPEVGETVVFTILVGNDGPNTATGVEVLDLLPSGYTYAGFSTTQGAYNSGTGFWMVGTLTNGQTETLEVSAIVNATGDYLNLAEVTDMDQPDTDSTPMDGVDTDGDGETIDDPGDDDDGDGEEVTPVRFVSIGSTVFVDNNDNGMQDADDDGIAGLTVELLDATGAVVATTTTDANGDYYFGGLDPGQYQVSVTPGTEFPTSSTPTDNTDNGQDGDDNGDQPAGSGTAVVSPLITLTPGTEPTNEAGQGGNQDASEDSNGDMTIDFGFKPEVDVYLEKSVSNATPLVGETIAFTILVGNDGPTTATGVEVTDLLPSGYTFAGFATSQGSYSAATGLWNVGTLNVNQTETLTVNAIVNATGDYLNLAEVTDTDQDDTDSTPDDGVDTDNDGDTEDDPGDDDDGDGASVTPNTAVDVYLEKSVNMLTPTVGETIQFTILVGNDGPNTATGVEVTDLLPSGYTYAGFSTTQGPYNPTTGLWNVGTLTNGATATLTVSAIVNATGDYLNLAEVTDQDQPDTDSMPGDGVDTDNDGDTEDDPGDDDDGDGASVTPNTAVDVYLEKSVNMLTPTVGETIQFTILVGNDGPNTATGVEVTDLLPSGYTYAGFSTTQGPYNPTTGLWNVGTLTNGATATLTVSAIVNATGDYLNLAEVTDQDQPDTDSMPGDGVDTDNDGDTEDDPGDDDDGDGASVTPNTAVDVYLEKSVNVLTPTVGETIQFTILVGNDGPNTATGVEVTDLLPSGYTYAGFSTTQGPYNPTTGLWNVGTLTNGATATLTVSAIVNATGDYLNLAEVTDQDQPDTDSMPGDGVDTDNDGDTEDDPGDDDDGDGASVTPNTAVDVYLEKSVNVLTPTVGETIQFTILVGNDGPNTATGVEVTDLLPSGYTYAGFSTTQGPYNPTTGLWNVGTLTNGATATLTVSAIVNATGDYLNLAEVTDQDQPDVDSMPGDGVDTDGDGETEDDPGDDDDGDGASVEPVIVVDVYLDKSVDALTPPAVGEEINFTIFVGNNGPNTATSVEVVDLLPSGYTYVSNNPSQGSYNPTTGLWTLGTLTSGQFSTLVITVTVNATGDYLNYAEVTNHDQTDIDSTPGNGVDTDGDGNVVDDPQDEDDGDAAGVSPTGPASLGNYVWEDSNADGIQDPTEDGINGVTVTLYEDANNDGIPDGPAIGTTVTAQDPATGDDGFYEFTGLTPGNYIVMFTTPTGFTATTPDYSGGNTDATDIANDSDVNPSTGFSHTVTLSSGENNDEIDAGYYELLALGNLIFLDENNNGIYDTEDTNNNGILDGPEDLNGNGVLDPGEDVNGNGILDPTEDVNGNGVWDKEPVLANVAVTLWEENTGDNIPDVNTGMTVFTDANGLYEFTNLAPGDYIVQVDPINFGTGSPLDGLVTSDDTLVTDPDDDMDNDDDGYDPNLGIGIISFPVTLASGTEPTDDGDVDDNTNESVDFGFYAPVALGNFVWMDDDADGVQDPGESGVNGVVVNLYDSNNPGVVIGTTTTANDPTTGLPGFYEFTNLSPGTYYLEFETPDGFTTTRPNNTITGTEGTDSDVDGTNGPNTTTDFTILSGTRNDDIDAGIYQTATIGDFVWVDSADGTDGVQDPTEPGLNGVTVNLIDAFGNIVATTTTNNDPGKGDGYYEFTDVPAGNYSVQFIAPSQYAFVTANVGGDDTTDSDVINFANGQTGTFGVAPGDNITDIDAGLTLGTVPVEFADFFGDWNKQRDINELTWITASEINNEYFVIERSLDTGADFQEIGKVDGNGNTSDLTTYTFDDSDIAKSGEYFYRLRQVDYDGNFSYSNTISIKVTRDARVDVNLYPNPAIDETTIKVSAAERSDLNVTIYDIKGKVISQDIVNTEIESGDSDTSIDISSLPAGSYVVRIKVGRNVFIEKLSVIR